MQRYAIVALLLCFSCLPGRSQSQPVYTYQQLSKTYYATQKDSLKKAWVCPDIGSTKAVQKIYREIWDGRTEFLLASIENQHYIYEPGLYNYLQGIIDQLAAGSPSLFTARPLLLIDRSPVANAYALGNNTLVINLGLISFSQSREELSLAIAHELSHNILHHVENAMREKADWLGSDEYKRSLNDVLSSKYGRYSRLQKALTDYSFSRSKHQRYHESDADSLAVILLKNSRIPFNAEFFLRLDSADIQYRQPLKKPLQEYFAIYHLPFNENWTRIHTRGLSTRTYNFADTTHLADSLQTHPDCMERYQRTLSRSDANMTITPIPVTIARNCTKMLLWNMFDDRNLTACLYRIWQEKDKGNEDQWFDFMAYAVFTGLYYSDKDLQRFNAIGIQQKEYISEEYYQLQTMLEQMPAESLQAYYTTLQQASFWSSRPADEKALKDFLADLCTPTENRDKARRISAENFTTNNPASMYCEFADQFRKK
jgi:Peptidase family M48